MRHSRRITALLVSLLLAHVTWVGTGITCAMPEMTRGPDNTASMAGMDMSTAEMSDMHMSDTNTSATMEHSPGSPTHDHQSCELPWAPDGCQSMAPCAPLALASLPQALRAPIDARLQVASRLVLSPPSQVRAPEPPPPRA